MKQYFLLIILLYSTAIIGMQPLQAQTNSTKSNDSINASLLNDYNKRMIEIDQQRIADSMKKEELQKEFTFLKENNNFKKDE